MPSNKWVLIAIGIALGMFVVPIAMGYLSGISAGSAPSKGM